jgi:hypothetical protein
MASLDQFSCPVCRDILYKPSANKCGHLFCFWCLHRAMNPYSPSKCPLCRSPFTHFPAVRRRRRRRRRRRCKVPLLSSSPAPLRSRPAARASLQVCTKLHSLLASTFPEEYALRAAETAEEEGESGTPKTNWLAPSSRLFST